MATIQELPEDSFWKSDVILNLVQNISEIDLKQFFNLERLAQYAKGAINVVNSIFDISINITPCNNSFHNC